jgi:hypothetical protein
LAIACTKLDYYRAKQTKNEVIKRWRRPALAVF